MAVNTGFGYYPLYSSIINYVNTNALNDVINCYHVMPGYRIDAYTNFNYSGTLKTCDNTNGNTILFQNGNVDADSSCRIYYQKGEIIQTHVSTQYN